jgi:hypothetical protein
MNYFGRRALRWRVLIVPGAIFACITVFRWFYFGALMPNTVYAKSGGLVEGIASGWVYFKNFYSASIFLWFALAVQGALFVTYSTTIAIAARAYPDRRRLPLSDILVFGLVLAAQLVVFVAGGDWMEHFRFSAPIVPLLAVLTVTTATNVVRSIGSTLELRKSMLAVLGAAAVFAVLANAHQSGLNTPRPLPRPNDSAVRDYRLVDIIRAGHNIDRAMMDINAVHHRDFRLLFPFFEDVFPRLYQRSERIVVATGQMGFFPYWLKRKYPEYDIQFVDTLGLCDSTVSHMPLNKDHTGVADGRYIDEILDGQVPLLTEYLNSKSPNLVYFLGYDPATDKRLQTYARYGFSPVQKKVGAVVLYREPEHR